MRKDLTQAWLVADALLTREQKGNAIEIAERWERWLADSENNRPPNAKAAHPKYQAKSGASGTTMRDRAWKGIKAISLERARDPEPDRRHFPAEHLAWCQREAKRQSAVRHWEDYL